MSRNFALCGVTLTAMFWLAGCKRDAPGEGTATIQGTVTHQRIPGFPGHAPDPERPEPGINVRVTSLRTDKVIAETKTDARGEFCFDVPTGRYRVDVVRPERSLSRTISPEEFTLEDGDIVEVQARLVRTTGVHGIVTYQWVPGIKIELQPPRPQPGIPVRARDGERVVAITTTDANGEFHLQLPVGKYQIETRPEDWMNKDWTDAPGRLPHDYEINVRPREVTLAEGDNVEVAIDVRYFHH